MNVTKYKKMGNTELIDALEKNHEEHGGDVKELLETRELYKTQHRSMFHWTLADTMTIGALDKVENKFAGAWEKIEEKQDPLDLLESMACLDPLARMACLALLDPLDLLLISRCLRLRLCP